MNKNKTTVSKNNKKFTKKNVISAILLVVLLLAAVGAAFGIASVKTEAATNRAGVYMLYGTYDIGDGSTSGYMDQFGIQIATQYFYDDSGTNGTTKYNYATYNWTYFSFYIHAEDIKEHVSFKLTRNGSTYTSKSLSGDGGGYLYQGALSDGDYVLTYVGTYKPNWFTTKTYTFTYNFTVDTTAPSVSLKAGGSTISSGSYTNKAITFTASDTYSSSRVYYLSPSASSYTWTTGSKSVSATSSNNGWWYFYGSDTYQSTSTYKVYLDTVAPVGKITNSSGTTLSSGSYTNKPVKYTATDTGGINYLQVQMPGSSSWTSYSSGTALSSATGWYYFRAVDTVCALFPLARAFKLEGENEKADPKKVTYLLQESGCPANKEKHTVRQWLTDFSLPLEDQYHADWTNLITELSSSCRELEKKLTDNEMNTVYNLVTVAVYLNYDTELDFEMQFDDNRKHVVEFLDAVTEEVKQREVS